MIQNGTAVDAAIAALVCNGAVHSHNMGLGGGFFMTIYKKAENKGIVFAPEILGLIFLKSLLLVPADEKLILSKFD